MDDKINAYKILICKPHGRPKCRWEGYIKINLAGIGCEKLDSTVSG
jgi:hypothetical protein